MRKGGASTVGKTTARFDSKKYAKPGLSEEQVIEAKQAFDLFDIEGHGFIETKQLKAAMKAHGFQAKNQTIFQMISDLESDGVGKLSFDQYLLMVTARVGQKSSKANIRKVFSLFDDEKTGFISMKNLRRIVKELGETISENELQQMIDRADKDNDGLVSEDQFYQIMTKK